MSFLKKLFGGGSARDGGSEVVAEITHEGYRIQATPIKEGGQFRLCAIISKEVGGEVKQHKLIRADLFASAEQAAEIAFQKAKQVIRERGEGMFG